MRRRTSVRTKIHLESDGGGRFVMAGTIGKSDGSGDLKMGGAGTGRRDAGDPRELD